MNLSLPGERSEGLFARKERLSIVCSASKVVEEVTATACINELTPGWKDLFIKVYLILLFSSGAKEREAGPSFTIITKQ